MRQAYSPDGARIVSQDDQVIRRYEVVGFDEKGNAVLDEISGGEYLDDTDSFDAYVDENGMLWQPVDLTFVDE